MKIIKKILDNYEVLQNYYKKWKTKNNKIPQIKIK